MRTTTSFLDSLRSDSARVTDVEKDRIDGTVRIIFLTRCGFWVEEAHVHVPPESRLLHSWALHMMVEGRAPRLWLVEIPEDSVCRCAPDRLPIPPQRRMA